MQQSPHLLPPAVALPPGPSATSSAVQPAGPMIVYDREGELLVRQQSFLGNTSWRKQYAVLSLQRRCLYLFPAYRDYEQHLAELNAFENEYRSWAAVLPLAHASVFVASGSYFTRPNVMELCCPAAGAASAAEAAAGMASTASSAATSSNQMIFYLQTSDEHNLRAWLRALGQAGVLLKSDEKPLLIWRPPPEIGSATPPDCFLYTRTSSALPAHEHAKVNSWESLATSMSFSTDRLLKRATASASVRASVLSGRTGSLRASPNSPPQPERDLAVLPLLGSEFTSDPSFGKHGHLQKLVRSVLARLYSDSSSASADPKSPFYDPAAAERAAAAAAGSSGAGYNRWLSRFYRTSETASGRACLVAFRDREQSRPSGKRKHVLQLFQARIVDLALVRAVAEQECRFQAQAEERERWRRKAEQEEPYQRSGRLRKSGSKRWARDALPNGGVGNLANVNGLDVSVAPQLAPSASTVDLFAEEKGPVRRARAQALAKRVQEAFLNHASLPEPLPRFAPSADTDFAVYTAAASGAGAGTAPGAGYLFFRATSRRDKEKWVQVLKNLAADQPQAVYSAQQQQLLPSASPEKSLSMFSPVGPASPLAHAVPSLDEREVHCSRRDFYALLGVTAAASTEQLTKSYRALQAELKARLQPLSPLHHLMPLFDETGAAAAASQQQAATAEDDESAPQPAKRGARELVQRVFSFDLPAKEAAELAAQARESPAGARRRLDSVLGPAPAQLQRALSPEQVQHRLRYKLAELREVWRVLRDPVRRCQYDERREALGLDLLLGEEQDREREEEREHDERVQERAHRRRSFTAAAAAAAFRHVLLPGLELPAASSTSAASSARGGTGDIFNGSAGPLSAIDVAAARVDLDAVLRLAQQNALKLPTPPLPVSPNGTGTGTGTEQAFPSTAGDTPPSFVKEHTEEKYPVPANGGADVPAASSAPTQGDANGFSMQLVEGHFSPPACPEGKAAKVLLGGGGSSAGGGATNGVSVSKKSSMSDAVSASATAATDDKIPPAPPLQNLRSSRYLNRPAGVAGGTSATLPKSASSMNAASVPSSFSSSSVVDEPWMPGDVFSLEWNPFWAGRGKAMPATAQRVKMELLQRKGSGWLSRVSLVQLLSEAAPDTGHFTFVLPLTLKPAKGYFVRMTLLPRAPGSEGAPGSGAASASARHIPVVTESAAFEVVPLQKAERYSGTTDKQRERAASAGTAAHVSAAALKQGQQERAEAEKKQSAGLLNTPLSPDSDSSSTPIVQVHDG